MPAFPIIQRRAFGEIALNQLLRFNGKIKQPRRVRARRHKDSQPRLIHAARHVARHERVNVTVGQHDETRLERRAELMVFKLVGKVRRVKQTQRCPA